MTAPPTRPAANQGATYAITVTNAGPGAATQARLRLAAPPTLGNVTWSCDDGGSGACPPTTGSGPLDLRLDLPVGARVVITLRATVNPGAAEIPRVTAAIDPPPGLLDNVPGNNTGTAPPQTITTGQVQMAATIPATTPYVRRIRRRGTTRH